MLFDELYRSLIRKTLRGEIQPDQTRNVLRKVISADFELAIGRESRFEITLPLSQLRKLPFSKYLKEFIWEFQGRYDLDSLGDAANFWAKYGDPKGEVACGYGFSWRSFPKYSLDSLLDSQAQGPTDQLAELINRARKNPYDTNLCLFTSIPTLVGNGVEFCPPCHPMVMFQFYNGRLNAHVNSRSWDLSLGFPNDVVRYSLLLFAFGLCSNLPVGSVFFSAKNLHIYENNWEPMKELLKNKPRPEIPRLQFIKPLGPRPVEISEITEDSFRLFDYNPQEFKTKLNFN